MPMGLRLCSAIALEAVASGFGSTPMGFRLCSVINLWTVGLGHKTCRRLGRSCGPSPKGAIMALKVKTTLLLPFVSAVYSFRA